jgi:hypothetical protein
MAEPLNEPIRKLQQAREQTRAQVEADVAGARDAYVPLLETHEQAERDWLQAPGDEQLAKRAQDTFDACGRAGRRYGRRCRARWGAVTICNARRGLTR